MDTCICIAESLPCSLETITTWLIDYTPIQNKNSGKKRLKVTGKKNKQKSVLD